MAWMSGIQASRWPRAAGPPILPGDGRATRAFPQRRCRPMEGLVSRLPHSIDPGGLLREALLSAAAVTYFLAFLAAVEGALGKLVY